MKRVITLDDETDNGKVIMAIIQNMHDPVVNISAPFTALTAEEWATAGSPATEAQVEYLLNQPVEGSVPANAILEQYKQDNRI